MVGQVPLEHFVQVRILAAQPELVIGDRLSVIGHRISVIGHRIMVWKPTTENR